MPKHTFICCRLTSFTMANLAVLFLCFTIGISELALVPEWHAIRLPLVLALGFCALSSMIVSQFVLSSYSRLRRILTTLFCTFLVSVIVLYSALETPAFLGGRTLLATIHQSGSGRWIYVYEYSEIPDGFKRSFVMERDSLLPVMHEIASVFYRIKDVRQNKNKAEIEYSVLEMKNNKFVRCKKVILYDFKTGKLETIVIR